MKQLTKIEEIKNRFAPVMTELGFFPDRSNRLWEEDHGCYLIAVELRPCFGGSAVMTSLHIHFLWKNDIPGAYAYSPNHSLCMAGDVFVPNSPTGALFYDDPKFEEHLSYVTDRMKIEINHLRRWDDTNNMEQDLINRTDLFYCQTRDKCNEVDFDLGVVKMLNGDRDGAMRIFHNVANRCEEYRSVLDHCGSHEHFRQFILERTNEKRAQYVEKFRFKLSPLDRLPF